MILYLREELAAAWAGRDVFPLLDGLEGEVYRHKEGRRTLRFRLNGRGYFLKLHLGVGWWEIVKNLLQLRAPVVGAENEWRAIRACRAGGIDTMSIAGYGKRGFNPARQQSFLITDELLGVQSLEEYCRRWGDRLTEPTLRRALVTRVGEISRRFHGAGINHRDFYLCHFLLGGNPETDPGAIISAPIYLIDLHRAQIRRRVPGRWRVKDLGALYFSAVNLGFGRRDVLRFLQVYVDGSAAAELRQNRRFWRAVRRRATAIHKRDFGAKPLLPL